MNDEIVVGKPYIKKCNGKARLYVSLKGACSAKELFFEVDESMEEYLTTDDADAFLLMLIEYAQINNCNLRFETPITFALLDYVNEYYIPLLAKNIKAYNDINVIAMPAMEKKTGNAVGTGFSAGVDSFYTLYKQLDTRFNQLHITHILFANVGAQTYDYRESCRIFEDKARRMKEIVLKVDDKIRFIEVNTNCLELYKKTVGHGFTGPDARKTCSCVVALKKLFHVYYFSNGPTLDRFSFSPKDPAHFDLFTIDMMNRTGIQFYLKGIETPKRIDKLKYIVDHKEVQQNLSVCVDKNCGRCEKCVRTELELMALQKLDDFKDAFDVAYFKKNIVKITAKYLAITEEHRLGFVQEIENEAKKHGVRIPRLSYILSFLFYHPLYVMKKGIKNYIQLR